MDVYSWCNWMKRIAASFWDVFLMAFQIKGIDQEFPYLRVKITEKAKRNKDLPITENEISATQGAGRLQGQEQRAVFLSSMSEGLVRNRFKKMVIDQTTFGKEWGYKEK